MDFQDIWSVYDAITAVKEEPVSNNNECKCGKPLFYDSVNGSMICMACGTVSEDNIMDQTPEWNSGSSENTKNKDPSRCGCPINPMLHKSSMSTMIVTNRYGFMKRLHSQMSMDYVERARYHIFERIAKVAGDIGNLPHNVIEQSKYYYKILSERKLSRGVIRQGLIACCMLHACKAMNVPRSMKEISNITGVTTATLNKTNKLFLKTMQDVLVISNNTKEKALEATNCKHLINRYCNGLDLDKKLETKLVRFSNRLNERIQEQGFLDCKTPSAVAAGIIMYSCGKIGVDISKSSVSRKFAITVVTINKITKLISEYETILEVHTI